MIESTINEIYTNFLSLPPVDKEYIAGIIEKQMVEVRHQLIKNRIDEAEENYRQGKVKSGGSADLIKDLLND